MRPPLPHGVCRSVTCFRYISASSRVVIANEKRTKTTSENEVIERKVALKFMKNRDQFQREKESREFFKGMDNYVVGIYYSYTQQDNKEYRDALANMYVPTSMSTRPQVAIVPRRVTNSPELMFFALIFVLSRHFNDFKDYPYLIVMPSADCDLKTIIR